MYDYLIVGAGFFGATFARIAAESGKKILVIDKRLAVGGNAHTSVKEGIVVHTYGPHIFHTSDDKVWNFVNRFAEFNNYIHRVKARNGCNVYSMPINLMTLHQISGVCSPEEAKLYLDMVTKPYRNKPASNLEEWTLAHVGPQIYEAVIRDYTFKQWSRHPSELPTSIIKRLPIRLTWDDNYFDDTYQGIPIGGYTPLIENMLSDSNIEVNLGIDFFNDREKLERLSKKTIYTGPIDLFYNNMFGALAYRTLNFKTNRYDVQDYQGVAQLNWTGHDVSWTRTVEHKHFDLDSSSKSNVSYVTYEYSSEWVPGSDPYYPINDVINNHLFNSYRQLSSKESRTIFGGRLGTYRYMDMAPTILSSIKALSEQGISLKKD